MLEFVITADGSKTIYNSQIGEKYHSKNGALQESKHVFLKSGLEYFLTKKEENQPGDTMDSPAVLILEVGFGTGLNFLISSDFCTNKQIELNYTGIEAYPLDKTMISQTGYDQYIPLDLWRRFIDNYEDALLHRTKINDSCTLQIADCALLEFKSEKQYDVIYFDAFALARQPEMWVDEAIAHTINFLKTGGIFVTYAITGNLKRLLKTLGCKIEKAPGAAGKREMLRAIKIA